MKSMVHRVLWQNNGVVHNINTKAEMMQKIDAYDGNVNIGYSKSPPESIACSYVYV